MPDQAIKNPEQNARHASANCTLCLSGLIFSHCPNTTFVQEQLLTAINILGLLVETAPGKQLTLASKIFDTDEIAVTTLNLICMVQKLEDAKDYQ